MVLQISLKIYLFLWYNSGTNDYYTGYFMMIPRTAMIRSIFDRYVIGNKEADKLCDIDIHLIILPVIDTDA